MIMIKGITIGKVDSGYIVESGGSVQHYSTLMDAIARVILDLGVGDFENISRDELETVLKVTTKQDAA